MTHPAIEEALPSHTDEEPTGSQQAFHAVVHLLLPGGDENGRPMDADNARDWISEALRDRFLDWGFVRTGDPQAGVPGDLQTPVQVTVCRPYVEGTFLGDS